MNKKTTRQRFGKRFGKEKKNTFNFILLRFKIVIE
jgi:hypothetical protein